MNWKYRNAKWNYIGIRIGENEQALAVPPTFPDGIPRTTCISLNISKEASEYRGRITTNHCLVWTDHVLPNK